jgi:copper(I)-binding protein
MRASTVFLLSLSLAVTASCGPTASGIAVSDAWARPAAGAGSTTSVYFEVANQGDETDRLVGGVSPLAEAVEIHETTMEGDMVHMMPVAEIVLPAGATIGLEPGGHHLMLVGLTGPLRPGDRVPLTLRFERAGDIQVEAEVREP